MSGKRLGDRRDGVLLRDIDSMHFLMPVLYPNRCDNEAFISERIDLSKAEEYLARKNAESTDDYRYNIFQMIVTAMLKVLTLRPKMNRFIANCNMYQRNEVSASFIVKKQFADNGGEGMAFIHSKPEYTIDDIHRMIYKQVSAARGEKKDSTTQTMDIFQKIPRGLSKWLIRRVMWLDRHGWVPQSFIAYDPYYSSVVLTNLGSIKLHSGYHHLINWGTNSVFVAVGERKKRPYTGENGETELRDSIDLGLTIDERIADGYYYSKTVRLLRKLLENPELLDRPLNEEVEYE